MPKFYHIHRSPKPSSIEKKLIKNFKLYYSKKNSFWYNVEQDIGKTDYGGYIIYEIEIPKLQFTTSFNPIKKNKIVKLTPKNIQEYIKILTEVAKKKYNFIEEMNNRNIIGIDATAKFIREKNEEYSFIEISEGLIGITSDEGFIWKFPRTIKIKKIKVYDNSKQ